MDYLAATRAKEGLTRMMDIRTRLGIPAADELEMVKGKKEDAEHATAEEME